ncbi:YolD-like family protein [Paenibacillus sp. WLX2291]|uniref:YolD-like family protein n=1 Tax=Paenibacillus sp. WLX2291 TaxID=3296934 RepID=UPI0039845DA0
MMNNEYQDRGNKKWSAMLLPEHRDRLRQMAEDERKVKRPSLDDDQWQELNHQLQTCLTGQYQVRIVYFERQAWVEAIGSIKKCDMLERLLYMFKHDAQVITISLHDIQTIEIIH